MRKLSEDSAALVREQACGLGQRQRRVGEKYTLPPCLPAKSGKRKCHGYSWRKDLNRWQLSQSVVVWTTGSSIQTVQAPSMQQYAVPVFCQFPLQIQGCHTCGHPSGEDVSVCQGVWVLI